MTFSPSWRTRDVVALARQIRESRDYGILPILADALQDAGCDDPSLAVLRDEVIVSSLSGLWLAGIEGKDGLWEWGNSLAKLAVAQNKIDTARRRVASGDRGLAPPEKALRQAERLRSRRAELQRLHTGGKGERWDECRCEKCGGDGYAERPVNPRVFREWGERCPQCGGSGDLLQRHHEGRRGTRDVARPLSFDLGPLPVVSARVEEIAREEECGTCAMARGSGYALTDFFATGICPSCSGTGRTWVPSEWLRSLPPWIDVTLEGVGPRRNYFGRGGWFIHAADNPILRSIIGAEFVEGDSPAAARLELCRAIRRWRFTS